jgi:hypothetical protein
VSEIRPERKSLPLRAQSVADVKRAAIRDGCVIPCSGVGSILRSGSSARCVDADVVDHALQCPPQKRICIGMLVEDRLYPFYPVRHRGLILIPASRAGVPVSPRATKTFPISLLSRDSGPTSAQSFRSAPVVSVAPDVVGDGAGAPSPAGRRGKATDHAADHAARTVFAPAAPSTSTRPTTAATRWSPSRSPALAVWRHSG